MRYSVAATAGAVCILAGQSFGAGLPPTFARRDTTFSRNFVKRVFMDDSPDENLASVGLGSNRYTTNVTIDGFVYPVMIDSGSNDLWVVPTEEHKSKLNGTGISSGVSYGGGTATKGQIAVGNVTIGNYSVPHQAFIAADQNDSEYDHFLGLQGLLGLGFAESSNVAEAIREKHGKTADWGGTFAANLFSQDDSKNKTIGVALSRSNDTDGSADSSLYFAELDPEYTEVHSQPKISLHPKDATSWDVLIEDITVDGESVSLKTTTKRKGDEKVPKDKLLTIIDTGGGANLLPYETLSGIFNKIPGAVEYKGVYNNASSTEWFLPCNASNVVEFTIGGQKIPMNPLDLSKVVESSKPDGSKFIYCKADAAPIEKYGTLLGYVDGLLSPPFMRNVYTLFTFGEKDSEGKSSDPFIQFLSLTDSEKAAKNVEKIREKNSPSKYQVSPDEVVKLLEAQDTSTVNKDNAVAAASIDDDIVLDDGNVEKYLKIAICLLAANLAVGIMILVCFCVRRRRPHERETVHYASMKGDNGYHD